MSNEQLESGRAKDLVEAIKLDAYHRANDNCDEVLPIELVGGDAYLIKELIKVGTEISVAKAFSILHKGIFKFDKSSHSWLIWNGRYWEIQGTGLVTHKITKMVSMVDKKTAHRRNFIRGVEFICQNDADISTNLELFDVDNYTLNCPDGTYDLRTGECHPHNPDDNLSAITLATPAAPKDYGKVFPVFIEQICCGDKDLMMYLQVALGACLSGAIESHWLLFFIGEGRNGKSTLLDVLKRAFGTYHKVIPSKTLMDQKNPGHATEIAFLKGARLALSSEVEQSCFWSESRINEITGDGDITARYMRGDQFTFRRTWKIVVAGNHRPRLNSVATGIVSRIKMIPFKASFLGKEDPELPEKLRREDGNILRWLMDGHAMWLAGGRKLPPCKAVDGEMNDYIDSQGTVNNWAAECVVKTDRQSPATWMASKDLYANYTQWKRDKGEAPLSSTVWGETVGKMFDKRKSRGSNQYNVRIIDSF